MNSFEIPVGRTTLAGFLEDRPFCLTLSSGFFGFFAHAGMAAALYERGLRPSAISGSSAGALVGGFLAAGLEPEDIGRMLAAVRRSDFWDPSPGPGLLAGRAFRRLLEAMLPQADFATLEIPTALSVHDIGGRQTLVMKRGDLAEAIHASCAVPGLFHPVRRNGQWLVDGGVSDRPGMAGARRDMTVLAHHLTSRSPWRLHEPRPASGPHIVSLSIRGLPRLGPFHLERGPEAFRLARKATAMALDLPLEQAMEIRAGR